MRSCIKSCLAASILIATFGVRCSLPSSTSARPRLEVRYIGSIDGHPVTPRSIDLNEWTKGPSDSLLVDGHGNKPPMRWAAIPLDTLFPDGSVASGRIKRIFISSPDGYYSCLSGPLLVPFPVPYFVFRNTEIPGAPVITRILFPSLKQVYWVNDPSRIRIFFTREKREPQQMRFDVLSFSSDPLLAHGPKTIRLSTLLNGYFKKARFIRFLTSDGMYREYPVNRTSRVYTLEQEEEGTWRLSGEKIHIGLTLREVFFVFTESAGLFMKPPDPEEKQVFISVYPTLFAPCDTSRQYSLFPLSGTGAVREGDMPASMEAPWPTIADSLLMSLFGRSDIEAVVLRTGEDG